MGCSERAVLYYRELLSPIRRNSILEELRVRRLAVRDVVRDNGVVLEVRPWPRDASRPNRMALALTLVSGPMTLVSKIHTLSLLLALRATLT